MDGSAVVGVCPRRSRRSRLYSFRGCWIGQPGIEGATSFTPRCLSDKDVCSLQDECPSAGLFDERCRP
jgi:hypothetical protein